MPVPGDFSCMMLVPLRFAKISNFASREAVCDLPDSTIVYRENTAGPTSKYSAELLCIGGYLIGPHLPDF